MASSGRHDILKISITICQKGADMNYYKTKGQMDLSDRLAIETGIHNKDSLKKIAKLISRHPSTVAREIKEFNGTQQIYRISP